ncbi:THAP domain-containing protein 5-like isoform X1 [Carcharodon carcharias]|uniref:THAP domain-containing protein 5-like isoform X1 n=1 Tax=Carcharodon carcharias TaxID=13397 RepID=UPI001B7E4C53|nr:THAP domain-containing protein 5-like isoform X1 [Carcharodon carcharias]
MPKNCTVTDCSRHAGQLAADNRRISFYKFPSNDKERLAQWLSNMKREKWVPSQYQYICSEHFTPDSFEWRWGTRYLKADAVPTIFSFPEQPTKRKVLARSNGNKRQKKRFETQSNEEETTPQMQTVPVLSPALSEPNAFAMLVMSTESTLSSQTTLSASVTELDKVAMSSVSACVESMSEAIIPSAESLPNAAVNSFGLLQMDKGKSPESVLTEPSVLPFENVAAIETVPLTPALASVETVETSAILPSVETLQLLPAQICEEPEPTLTFIEIVLPATQDIENLTSFQPEPPTPVPSPKTSIFEDITALTVVSTYQTLSLTNVSSQTSPILLTAASEPLKRVSGFETLLSLPSALLVPIMSTLPIMQSHAVKPPGPVIAAVETVTPALPDLPEVQGEHSYYKSDLTTEQLEGIITNLQKKVKVIQQRERRNSARLKAMENLVDQLKKENVLSEEKLKIMEMTYSQNNAQVINPSSTLTVVCEDNGTIIYALQQSPNEDGDAL